MTIADLRVRYLRVGYGVRLRYTGGKGAESHVRWQGVRAAGTRAPVRPGQVPNGRRVGKTALLDELARGKRALFFTAQWKSDAIHRFFGLPESTGAFVTWEDGLRFVAERARGGAPRVCVFSEFPYDAQAQPSLP